MTIRGLYGELLGLYTTISDPKLGSVEDEFVEQYNSTVDNLNIQIADDRLERFKITHRSKVRHNQPSVGTYSEWWDNNGVKAKIYSLVSYLEHEFQIERQNVNQTSKNQPSIVILNQNTLAVTINQTLDTLIQEAKNKKEKEKLTELNEELKKPNQSWEKISPILIWIINYGRDLSLQVIPIILKALTKI
jgi:hypothetical protein